MLRERLYQVLVKPHVSEKSALVADKNNQYVFDVAIDANKIEIKQAVKSIFKVDVASVQIVRQNGKRKMFGQVPGRRNNFKKAYVRLKDGQEIQFAERV